MFQDLLHFRYSDTHQLIQERLFGWSIPTFKIPDLKFLETRSNGFYFVFMHPHLAAKLIQTPKDSFKKIKKIFSSGYLVWYSRETFKAERLKNKLFGQGKTEINW